MTQEQILDRAVRELISDQLKVSEVAFRSVRRYEVIDRNEGTTIYKVVYKEVICGISGDDTTQVTLSNQEITSKVAVLQQQARSSQVK
jgi:hypothetical protein